MRRRLTSLLLGISLPAAVLVAPVVGGSAPAPHPVAPQVQHLSLGASSGTSSGARTLSSAEPAAGPEVLTAQEGTGDFDLVGVTWDQPEGAAPADLRVSVRTRTSGDWSDWTVLESDRGVVPDEGSRRVGTDPLWAGGSDGVQVQVDVLSGSLPPGLRAELIDPGTSAADAHLGDAPLSTAAAATGKPTVITRAQWGADESMRGSLSYTGNPKVIFIHHTASTNGYSKGEAAAAVRAIYAYAVKGLDYSDIPYNVIVDQYGEIFEGRAGGLDKAVKSAATGGFNDNSWAVSALGTFNDSVPAVTLTSIERIVAWKLGLAYSDPFGKATLTAANAGGTTSRYDDGTKVTFNVISGHRNAGSTECPGDAIYAKLGSIRTEVARYLGSGLVAPAVSSTVVQRGDPTPVTVTAKALSTQSWRLDVMPNGSGTPLRTLTGTVAEGSKLAVAWDGKVGTSRKPGVYRLRLSSWNGTDSSLPYEVNVNYWPDPNTFDTPANGVFELSGLGYGHGHGMSQFGAEGQAVKGRTASQVLSFYYPGTKQQQLPVNARIRVRLTGAVGTASSLPLLRIRAVPNLWVSDASRFEALPATVSQGDVVEWQVRVTGGDTVAERLMKVVAKTESGELVNLVGWKAMTGTVRFTKGTAAGFTSRPAAPTTSRVTVLRGTTATTYRGTLNASRSSDGTALYAVSDVLYDDYAKAVVSHEVPSSWHDATFQAMAIAARTYGRHQAEAASSTARWDVVDTTSDQAYGGFSGEDADQAAQADATSLTYLTYSGAAAFTQYSSANGGWTADGGYPYMPAKEDPYDGVLTGAANWGHSWSGTMTAASVAKAYPSVGAVTRISVVRDGHGEWGGRTTSVTVIGTKGRTTVSSGAFRVALGLRSEWWIAAQEPPQPDPDAPDPPAQPKGVRAASLDRAVLVRWTSVPGATAYRVKVGSHTVTVSGSATSARLSGLINGTRYPASVVAVNAGGQSAPVSITATPTSAYAVYRAASPRRLSGLPGAGQTAVVTVRGRAGVPEGSAVAYVALRIAGTSAGRSARVFAGPDAKHLGVVLRVPRHDRAVNTALVRLSASGTLALRVVGGSLTGDAVVMGWWTTKGGAGSRVASRAPALLGAHAVAARRWYAASTSALGPRPKAATHVLASVTVSAYAKPVTLQVMRPTGVGAMAVIRVPAGERRSISLPLPVTAGMVRVGLTDGSGWIRVEATGWLVDDAGRLAGGRLVAVPAVRAFESVGPLAAGKGIAVPVAGLPGLPRSLRAVVLQVSAQRPVADGVLIAGPSRSRAGAYAVAFRAGSDAVGQVIVPVGPDGRVRVVSPQGGVRLAVDIVGFVS